MPSPTEHTAERDDVRATMEAMLAVSVAVKAMRGEMGRATLVDLRAMSPAEIADCLSAAQAMLAELGADTAPSARRLVTRPRVLPGLVRRAQRP